MTRHAHTEDFTEQGAAPMRDLIDRAELLKFMQAVLVNASSEGCSAAFILAYKLAMRDVEIAARVTVKPVEAFDA